MRGLRTILCPVDFSATTAFGLSVAESIGRQTGASLLLLHVLPPARVIPGLSPDGETGRQQRLDEARSRLQELAGDVRRHGVLTEVRVETGIHFQQITTAAEDDEIGLIVMPTHGRMPVDRLLYGTCAERVVRTAPKLVLGVPPRIEGLHEFHPRRVLLAADLSSGGERAFAVAVDLARTYEAELIIGHVFTYAHMSEEGPEWWWPTLTKDQVEKAVAEAARRLERLAERAAGRGVACSTDLSQGARPAAEIIRLVEEEQPDVLVAGAGGRGLRHALLGSNTERLLRACPCPLLTVPEMPAQEGAEGTPSLVPAGV